MRHLEKSDRRGRQKVLILIVGLSVSVGGEGRSCWGGRKVLISTIAVPGPTHASWSLHARLIRRHHMAPGSIVNCAMTSIAVCISSAI